MVTTDERPRAETEERLVSDHRSPVAGGAAGKALRVWTGAVGGLSLLVERLVRASGAGTH